MIETTCSNLVNKTHNTTQSKSFPYASEARYDLIVKAAGLGAWEWDYQTGKVIYNDIWFQMLGYQEEHDQVHDTSFWFKIIHPDDIRISEKAIEKHIKGKTEYYQCELRLKHKNGKYI